MATHEALREDVMTLVRHVAAEFRRARPDYVVNEDEPRAPKLDEAATAAKYELHAVRMILCALAPAEVLRKEVQEVSLVGPVDADDEYDGVYAHEYVETALGKIDEDLMARVTNDIHADARIAPMYKLLIESALTVAFTQYASGDDGVVAHDTPWGILNDLPIVFPRLEIEGTSATLELTMLLSEISSERAYVRKWEARRRGGLERLVRVYPMEFAHGRLFAFARSKGVGELVVAGEPVRLDDDESEARIVEQFWEPSEELWGDFTATVGSVWSMIVEAQLEFVRAASGSHPQFAARAALPYPRTLFEHKARSTAGRRPARYDD
jgi:hypothetical protein